MIRVTHLAYSDISGGAARAAYRIHRCLVEYGCQFGIKSRMHVIKKLTQDPLVKSFAPKGLSPLARFLRPGKTIRYYNGFTEGKRTSFSVAYPNTGLLKDLNDSEADIFNLHWLGNDTLSIEEIGMINKPVVWRLPDMWAFSGAEHYVKENNLTSPRYVSGYLKSNYDNSLKGKDLNRIVWERKVKSWKKPIHIISPTNWLAECVHKSYLMKDWPVTVIPTAIDLELWKPKNKNHIRYALGLPIEVPIILFGAMGGTADPRKGGDLLYEALGKLKSLIKGTYLDNIELVVFGQSKPDNDVKLEFPVHYMGQLNDDITLSMLYAAADVMIVPSRQDNLPGTAIESLSCGTPVVSFEIGGLPDLIEHKQNGWMSKPFDTTDMAEGILWILNDKVRYNVLSQAARRIAEERYHPRLIATKYTELYNLVLRGN